MALNEPPLYTPCERKKCPRRARVPARYCCAQCLPPHMAGKSHTDDCQFLYETLDQKVIV